MTSRTVFLEPGNARERMAHAWKLACDLLQFGKPVRVRIDEKKPTRTLDQNALMWAVLTDIARQVEWPVDGKLQLLEPDDWKDILSAGLRKTQRVAQGIEGGFVMLGQRTSRMTIGDMSELIELAYAFGSQHGVVWHEQRKAA
ncbi:recombination protein NinB [Rhodanobacter caeni]|uniref:NinB protein n=1 Tax=Rhodanobacter caeni TaxID=657654 RepID=A0ABP3EHB3_9GAMM